MRTVVGLFGVAMLLAGCATDGAQARPPLTHDERECRELASREAFFESSRYDSFGWRRRYSRYGYHHRSVFDDPFFYRVDRERQLYAFCLRSRDEAAFLRGRSATPSGSWRNPDAPAQTGDGASYCREFQDTVTVEGKQQQVFGTACRQPDGSWRIVDQNPVPPPN